MKSATHNHSAGRIDSHQLEMKEKFERSVCHFRCKLHMCRVRTESLTGGTIAAEDGGWSFVNVVLHHTKHLHFQN